jgi:hypothetical protein
MTMAVNMAYVPKPESWTKVLKVLIVFRRVDFRGGHWKKKFV